MFMRKKKTFILDCPILFKKKLLFYLDKRSRFCFLDNNNNYSKYSSFDYLAAFGVKKKISPEKNIFGSFKSFLDRNKDWVFGHFSYDLKNELENLNSLNKDSFEFKKLNFFIPFYIFKVKKIEPLQLFMILQNQIFHLYIIK